MKLHQRLTSIIEAMPSSASVTLSVSTISSWLLDEVPVARDQDQAISGLPSDWQVRLWVVPSETRLSVDDVAEAVGRSRQWVYHHTSARSTYSRLPYRKLDGRLVFQAGEIRDWLANQEERVSPGDWYQPT